ncbi:3-hydroxybutyryl-CoA dehydrogenase [Arthrobacter sp. B2I5]|uniref:3-hydroxyacyl-CoA dehydrogenase family protein n=1 Tax=Arthrobacter sp. B2I5 TaxID=3042266 RepID=UPI0027844258|nr:3-hydroxyacyl-CoA dehydrogenase family protein [Arthrobacter sp. B2I5]MDQ0826051.1 3-hydroxybutyryl-CoA dehydrogenase [Arthrobacter sp. B2I5]
MSAAEGANQREIERVLVVGAGAMGSQIAMVFALAGHHVTIQDIAESGLTTARKQLEERMDTAVAKGRTSASAAQEALSRLSFTTDLGNAASAADFVIEAATERLEIKQQIFADLDRFAPPHAILATNSSTLGSSKVAKVTHRPEQVCNVHFFNPALVMKCVEVVRHPQTSQATVDIVMELVRKIGKQPVLINKEIPGFVANRLMGVLRDEALNLLGAGIASTEDIDTAAKTALGHPMGPFELMDLVGIDINCMIAEATYAETTDPADLPHPMLREMHQAGNLGRKSGKGWYTYER